MLKDRRAADCSHVTHLPKTRNNLEEEHDELLRRIRITTEETENGKDEHA